MCGEEKEEEKRREKEGKKLKKNGDWRERVEHGSLRDWKMAGCGQKMNGCRKRKEEKKRKREKREEEEEKEEEERRKGEEGREEPRGKRDSTGCSSQMGAGDSLQIILQKVKRRKSIKIIII
ncbi:hypothetical protein M0R45_035667 [Rubus argutus]|uniref:Uncharacterized protein n=1 Tax=Rubus argutus TaxID=59490 RepID=A0AAW1VUP8_RUBAR